MDKDRLCAETGKVIKTSEGAAAAQLRSLQEYNGYPGCVYPCIYCKGWHVGRAKKNAKKNKYHRAHQ